MKTSRNETQQQATDTLGVTENWFPDNLALINSRLKEISARNTPGKPVAVFDFDNTCVFRDVGQAVFRYQLLQLRYRIAPEQLAEILPTLPGDLAGRPLAIVTSTLMQAYQQLWPLIADKEEEQ